MAEEQKGEASTVPTVPLPASTASPPVESRAAPESGVSEPNSSSTPLPVQSESVPQNEPIETATVPPPVQDPNEEDDEHDSALDAASRQSDTTSLRSDITKYRFENNRRYHAYKDGEYWGPNDEIENNKLDIAHHLYLLTLNNKLFLAPIGDNPQKVLDVGTGTGIVSL